MSVLTPKRLFPVVLALFFGATAFAGHPSPRSYARMTYDPKKFVTVLFGGESTIDSGTSRAYNSDETWIWNAARWTQVFPATHPDARAAHGMVYDSLRSRIVLFGGRQAATSTDTELTLLNDTWVWNGSNWSQIQTPNAPEPRQLFSMTYDSARDRIILFGGSRRTADGKSFEPAHDTWEFDGTTWTRVADGDPQIAFPQLAYDASRNQTVLVGVDSAVATQMYIYNASAHTWDKQTPEKLPACVNDSSMVYRSATNSIVLQGGLCSLTTPIVDQTWEWNGTNWAEITTNNFFRATAQAYAYDALRNTEVLFGGLQPFTTLTQSITTLFQNDVYRFAIDDVHPSPRSLGAFQTDPNANTVWLFGGLSELSDSYIDEFNSNGTLRLIWGYRNGGWFSLALDKGPSSCASPLSAYDTARSRLVVTCGGASTFEFDGTAWTTLTPKNNPPERRFAALAYDENLKKTVFFGGFDGTNFRNDTWTWDGTNWTEVKKNKPPNRSLMAVWYDPLQKKTILYGGLGRASIDERITRYSDMYAFDGTGWKKLTVSTTPGERFGTQFAVDPRSGKLVLFGGLRSLLDTATDVRSQFYGNDTWIWDGGASTWTQVTTAAAPSPRENGMMAYDPVRKEIVLFGGYAGLYYSDTWAFDGANWTPRVDATGTRRRTSSPGREITGPAVIGDMPDHE
jgi:hypothetical protein